MGDYYDPRPDTKLEYFNGNRYWRGELTLPLPVEIRTSEPPGFLETP